jgi:hypothetical protein
MTRSEKIEQYIKEHPNALRVPAIIAATSFSMLLLTLLTDSILAASITTLLIWAFVLLDRWLNRWLNEEID